MDTTGLGIPVTKEEIYRSGFLGRVKWIITPKEIKKRGGGGLFFDVTSGKRYYDILVAMLRASQAGIKANEAQWHAAAIAVQYDYSHKLKEAYLTFFPNTYDYTKR